MSGSKFMTALAIGEELENRLDRVFSGYCRVERVSLEMQRQGIDRIFHTVDGGQVSVEYKSDQRAHQTGNAFIETISVDSKNIQGWVYTSQASVLAYYVPGREQCYLIDFVDLRSCLDEWKAKYRTVATRAELNDNYRTQGVLVPLQELVNISFETLFTSPLKSGALNEA